MKILFRHLLIIYAISHGVLCAEDPLSITIEQAETWQEKTWGLMQRRDLPENHGMLFIYEKPQILSFWMFNCFMDLSVAFLDKDSVITEIREMRAFPEKMDPQRPVLTLRDTRKYPLNDPILLFFYKNRITSTQKAQFALEMRANWFKDNEIKIGDRLIWRPGSSSAEILRLQGIRGQKGKSPV